MSWERKQAPSPARQLDIKRGMTADRLAWSSARDNSGADYLMYNVYASEDYPVDVNDAANLISIRQRLTTLSVTHRGRPLNYAVTATDRYGNESAAIASVRPQQPRQKIDFRQLIVGRPNKKNFSKRKKR